MSKFYLLYNNKQQEKLLTTARNEEQIKLESEYYTFGAWFRYDEIENSSVIENEKEIKGIKFPAVAKIREKYSEASKKLNLKWVA